MIETDDEMFRVDQHYLGPPGRAFPRPIRHQAVGFGFLVGFGIYLVLFPIVSLPINTWTLTAWGGATYWLTRRFLEYLGHERTVTSMVRSAINDLTSPRPGAVKKAAQQPHTVAVSAQLDRIRIDPAPAHANRAEKATSR
ncbi:MAG: hypothetical protein WBD41_17680 [Rhodococcus sp. (in: high G+C Gram-positive bacteria)]